MWWQILGNETGRGSEIKPYSTQALSVVCPVCVLGMCSNWYRQEYITRSTINVAENLIYWITFNLTEFSTG